MNEEDRRAEYTALRAEILQSDRTCLLMMGYLIAAVGLLYSKDLEWLVSFLSFIALCYFTEKRFSISVISSYIGNNICKDDSGFKWDKEVLKLEEQCKLRPFQLFHPYNVEVIICSVAALSPLFNDTFIHANDELSQNIVSKQNIQFWLFFTILTVIFSFANLTTYHRKFLCNFF